MNKEELEAKEDKLSHDQRVAAKFGTAGRWICAIFFLGMCVTFGLKIFVWQIVGVAVFVVVLAAYIVAVLIITKKLEVLRAEIRPEIPYIETEIFKELAADFTLTDMKAWTDKIACASVRAFRDDVTLEVEFTCTDKSVYSAVFDNDRARLVVDADEESAYVIGYEHCCCAQDVLDAIEEQIVELIRKRGEGNGNNKCQ